MSKRILLAAAVLTLMGTAPALAELEPGSPAPDFTLSDTYGQIHTLSGLEGQVVVLEWINPDCPFVKKHYAARNMQGLQSQFKARGVVWLAICSSAPGKQGHYNAADWNAILEKTGSRASALLLDPEGKTGLAYGAKTTPHLFVIDAEGRVAYNGAIDDNPSTNSADIPDARPYLVEALEAVLAGEPVPVAQTTPYGCSVKY
jgi:peroxiredoxin